MKKFFLAIMLAVVSASSMEAISSTTAYWWSKIAALGTGGSAYICAGPDQLSHPFKNCGIKDDYWEPTILGAVSFGGTDYLIGSWLNRFTPQGRYKWAFNLVRSFESKYLFAQAINQSNLEDVLQESGCQAEELPLMTAFYELRYFDQWLSYTLDQLDKALNDEGITSFGTKINNLKLEINNHLKRIRRSLAVLKGHNNWQTELQVIEKRKLQREKIDEKWRMERWRPFRPHSQLVWRIN